MAGSAAVALERTARALEHRHSAELHDRHVASLQSICKVVDHFDLSQARPLASIFRAGRRALDDGVEAYTEPLVQLLRICVEPMGYSNIRDGETYRSDLSDMLTELGAMSWSSNFGVSISVCNRALCAGAVTTLTGVRLTTPRAGHRHAAGNSSL